MQINNNIRSIKKYIPGPLKFVLKWVLHCIRYDRYMQVSYSQEGEDLILNSVFGSQKSGFYVDVGAHHPKRFSNTYIFYRRGWRGINIDAMPGSMVLFKKVRSRDKNLEIPILKERKKMKYYHFNEPALNGFSGELSQQRDGRGDYKVVKVEELEGFPLRDILNKHIKTDAHQIDFMSIDVEGIDLEVLESNDWDHFRPKVLLVELRNSSLESVSSDPIYRYLLGKRYFIFAKSAQTVFFMSEEYMIERDLHIGQLL